MAVCDKFQDWGSSFVYQKHELVTRSDFFLCHIALYLNIQSDFRNLGLKLHNSTQKNKKKTEIKVNKASRSPVIVASHSLWWF